MERTRKRLPGAVLLLMCLFLLGTIPARAQDPTALSKEIKQELRNAQSVLFKGNPQEAQGLLEGIKGKIDQLKAAAPNHNSLKGLEGTYDKMQRDISRRLTKASAPKSSTPTASKSGSDKLPAGASRCIREMDRAMAKAERALIRTGAGTPDSKAKQARYEMESAEMYWKDLQNKYPETIGHSDVSAAKGRMDDIYVKIASFEKGVEVEKEKAGQAESSKEATSNVWLGKIRPYIASRNEEGHAPEKEFIEGYTENASDMNHRMELFAEASNLFTEYRKAEFLQGKSEKLQEAEKKLAYKLDSFKKELDGQAELYVQKATDELKRGHDFLGKNDERCKDGKTKPVLLHDDVIKNLAGTIAWVENLIPGDGRLAGLQERFDNLKKKQSKWRERMIESTVMLPETFSGKESGPLRDNAKEVVQKAFKDAKILRVNVISPDWKEEQALEFTDTTKTAVRYRVTRSVTVQVAAKRGGDCFLYSVYVGKDRRSDGSWTQLFGHIMFTDRMLEKNVKK